jgi:hypothetical protein
MKIGASRTQKQFFLFLLVRSLIYLKVLIETQNLASLLPLFSIFA